MEPSGTWTGYWWDRRTQNRRFIDMAETTLLLNGFSIIGDPHTNSNAKAGGNLFIHGGDAVFEADDICVYRHQRDR